MTLRAPKLVDLAAHCAEPPVAVVNSHARPPCRWGPAGPPGAEEGAGVEALREDVPGVVPPLLRPAAPGGGFEVDSCCAAQQGCQEGMGIREQAGMHVCARPRAASGPRGKGRGRPADWDFWGPGPLTSAPPPPPGLRSCGSSASPAPGRCGPWRRWPAPAAAAAAGWARRRRRRSPAQRQWGMSNLCEQRMESKAAGGAQRQQRQPSMLPEPRTSAAAGERRDNRRTSAS